MVRPERFELPTFWFVATFLRTTPPLTHYLLRALRAPYFSMHCSGKTCCRHLKTAPSYGKRASSFDYRKANLRQRRMTEPVMQRIWRALWNLHQAQTTPPAVELLIRLDESMNAMVVTESVKL